MHDSTVQFSIQSLDKKTFQDLIIHVINFFKSHKMTNCKNEIEWFLQDLLQYDKAQLYEKQKGLIDTKHYNHINNFVNQPRIDIFLTIQRSSILIYLFF